eukprot:216489-Pelagomonas_calceolata.AAC.3
MQSWPPSGYHFQQCAEAWHTGIVLLLNTHNAHVVDAGMVLMLLSQQAHVRRVETALHAENLNITPLKMRARNSAAHTTAMKTCSTGFLHGARKSRNMIFTDCLG